MNKQERLEEVAQLVTLAKHLTKNGSDFSQLKEFFVLALLSYYNPMLEGLGQESADIIYRLSDFVDKDVRKTIPIYPNSQNGDITLKSGKWDSLEQWREEYLQMRKEIPTFTKALPPNLTLLLESNNKSKDLS